MTFCVAAKVDLGLVALADTRIVKGNEQSSKGKVASVNHSEGTLFFMTSGLRSVRDKTSVYFEASLADKKRAKYPTCLRQLIYLVHACARFGMKMGHRLQLPIFPLTCMPLLAVNFQPTRLRPCIMFTPRGIG